VLPSAQVIESSQIESLARPASASDPAMPNALRRPGSS
jgi:hypothetical protein